jgi:hypothetical protein
MSKEFVPNEQYQEIVLLRRNDGDDVLQHGERTPKHSSNDDLPCERLTNCSCGESLTML